MLITADDVRAVRRITDNAADTDSRIELYIREVEELVIIPALTASTYKSISENPGDYDLILNGGYDGEGSAMVYIGGLKKAIAYLAYSRWIPNHRINITSSGAKIKTDNNSREVEDIDFWRHVDQAKKTGKEYLQQVIDQIVSKPCEPAPTIFGRDWFVIG